MFTETVRDGADNLGGRDHAHLYGVRTDVVEHRVKLQAHEIRRRLLDARHSERVLRRERGNDSLGIKPMRCDGFDIGLDASLIGAYGHDDRVCGYAGLQAILELSGPAKTAVCMLADKEEIGSMGVTGMQSAAFDTFMHDLCDGQGVPLRACYENSFCLSCDVTAAYDPNFPEVFEKRNAAFVNYGIGLCKYTGARGKSGASDASAETVAYVRRVLDEADVLWHISELGKVDAGGGGTVAMYMANRNIATLDAGVPVLSMHAPFETVSKLDCYMTYKGCKAIYEAE